ncbi:MAG: HepT-like ribonuclease domain-containing protein [Dehalococcoidia bacterium]
MQKLNHKDDIIRVRHMLDFARKAVQFNKGKSRADLDSNEMLAMATIHLIELIGEASRTISAELHHQYPEIPWDLISGTRNRLIYGYIDVDLDVVWTIVTKDLPLLIVQLRRILKDEVV